MKAVILVGGSRGTALSIASTFSQHGFLICTLSRRRTHSLGHHIFLDIEDQASISQSFMQLSAWLLRTKPSKTVFFFFTGGALGLSKNEPASCPLTSRVLYHNYLFPVLYTTLLLDHDSISFYHFNYFLSSSQHNNTTHPIYALSKSLLQDFITSAVSLNPNRFSFSAFKLGIVDVPHKYFHKLSLEDPSRFRTIFNALVPSKYFPSCAEVANFIFHASSNSQLANGMICDLSGGSSWL